MRRDLLIVISSSGSTKDVLHAVTLAKGAARVIAISNTQRSPLAKMADTLLVAAKPEGPLTAGALPAKVGAMLLVELMIAELAQRDPAYAQAMQATASAPPLLL